MGDDLAVANAARVSFNKRKTVFEDGDAKLINYLAKNEHTTPFRHPQISLLCYAPIFLARQLGKHQVGLSWNEVSRRYVHGTPEFFTPETWRSKPEGNVKQGSGESTVSTMRMTDRMVSFDIEINDAYQLHCSQSLSLYNEMLKAGVAPEQARMVLPQSMITTWIWTGSLLAFFHVWRLRSDGHAQKEARDFANDLDKIMSTAFPVSWLALKEAA